MDLSGLREGEFGPVLRVLRAPEGDTITDAVSGTDSFTDSGP